MTLDVFDYFWNTYRDLFSKYNCIDDYTQIYIIKDNIFHFETAKWDWASCNDIDIDNMINDFDIIIKEMFGNVPKIKTEKTDNYTIIIEYQITDEIKDAICILSKVNGYEVFESEL